MCGSFGFYRPQPAGIPLTDDIYEQYPAEVQQAWNEFDAWWHKQTGPVGRSNMPTGVLAAFQLILDAPIPGHGEATGKDSCYMVNVVPMLTD